MQACFTLGCLYWLMEAREAKKWPLIQIVSFSLLVSLSLLTRLDSVLLVGPTALGATLLLVRGPISTQQKIVKASILWLLIASVMLLWFAWKISYYGSVLPNTFYAKAAAPKNFKVGLYYLILFAMTYCLIPFGVLFLVSFKRFVKYMSVPLIALGTPILLWCVYVVWINGDFMEFRMMVPVIPLLVLFATFLTVNILPNGTGRYAFLVLLVVGSLAGYAYQGGWWIESVKDLRQQLIGKGKDWIRIGQTLGKIFLDKQGVTIATTAAGAIPYYSGLTTIDMFGLNDPWVAKQGRFIGPRPGHQRMATLEYLLQRQVNLVVSHPQVMPNDYCVRSVYSRCELINYLLVHPEDESKIPVDSVVLEIPMSDTHKLVVLYLVRSAEVEEVIRKQGWKWYPIDKGRCNCS